MPAAAEPSTTARPARATATRRRAPALPPAERRAAIVDATLPVLLEHGSGVTTRQIAEAAGVAEGTLFRVFADKDELVAAVVEAAFDPTPVRAALRAIDDDLPLEARLTAAVEILQRRVDRIFRLMTAVGLSAPPEPYRTRSRTPTELQALAALFEPDRHAIRTPPTEAAQLLRGLVFGCSHPLLIEGGPRPAAEIVSLLLDGIRHR